MLEHTLFHSHLQNMGEIKMIVKNVAFMKTI